MALPRACLPSGSDTNTGSSASLARIKAWLDICTSSHPACARADSQPPPLPTRVIAVGTKKSSKCYLVCGNKKNGYYATLSHCWGDPKNRPLSTTDWTLSCRKRGIEDESLPKTFRHAVQVCRELGIEYIWIDSLCIIQEQETQEDWAKEAPRMGQVYGNSTLNISAATAEDSTQGCFRERLGLMFWPCPIVLFGQACYLFRYPSQREESIGDPEESDKGKSNVLARRAWVLQEQILSRRSIIFSKTRLIWRCPTLSTNEKYPLGIPHLSNPSVDNHRLLHCILNGITSSILKESTVDPYNCWYIIIADFTSRKLTYEEDRLPAIAGIAKRFGAAVNDSYHAGLWRHDMICGLLWHAADSNYTGATKSSAKAPSWSWASINGCVTYPYLFSANPNGSRIDCSPLVDILDVSDPITCEDHPFGATSRASLSLSGVLFPLMQAKHEDSGLALVENGICNPDVAKDVSYDIRGFEGLDPASLVCLPICGVHERRHRGTPSSEESCKASWKISLEMGTDDLEEHCPTFGLVLQAVEKHQDTFRRVGLCNVERRKTAEISRMALLEERRIITLI